MPDKQSTTWAKRSFALTRGGNYGTKGNIRERRSSTAAEKPLVTARK